MYTLAVVVVLALAAALLRVTGHGVLSSAAAAWRGAFGSADAVLSSTLVRAVPFMLLGVAVALSFRVGVFNIGGDGQFLAGATGATWAALAASSTPAWLRILLALVAGAATGALWGLAPALMRRYWRVFEVLSTLMMNFIAAYAVSYLVRGPLQEPLGIYPQSAVFPGSVRLPIIVSGTRLHAGILIAVACCVAAWVWLTFREAGFRARLTGANPVAASTAGGIDTAAVSFRVFVASAAICGIAGATEVLGVTFALYENLSPGYGFTGIAVALLAGLHPLWIPVTGVVLAALDAGASAMQREAGVPSVTAWVVQALLILAVLAGRALPRLAKRGSALA